MHLNIRVFLAISSLIGLSTSAFAMQYKVSMSDAKAVIDGNITAEEKADTSALNLGKVGSLDKPAHATKAYIKANLKGIYVAFECSDPDVSNLVTTVTQENGPVFNDDSVQVVIIPKMETAADDYFHFAVNGNGIKYSNYLLTGENVANWISAVQKTSNGWSAEFFIPNSSIKAPAELPYWRANFGRTRPAHGSEAAENSAWVNPGISIHNYKKFGYLTMPRFVPDAPGVAEYTTSTVDVITTQSK